MNREPDGLQFIAYAKSDMTGGRLAVYLYTGKGDLCFLFPQWNLEMDWSWENQVLLMPGPSVT